MEKARGLYLVLVALRQWGEPPLSRGLVRLRTGRSRQRRTGPPLELRDGRVLGRRMRLVESRQS